MICDGYRAEAGSSLQQQSNKSLIPELTSVATLERYGLNLFSDGAREAIYEGRGAHRDVYRVGSFILKLSTDAKERLFESNELEAKCLRSTEQLPQTPSLIFEGRCTTETKAFRGSQLNCITQSVNCIITTFAGPSLDNLMHKFFAMPYKHTIANFFVSAYQDLGVMCVDGRHLTIAYSDMHTVNVSALSKPEEHVPGNRVPCVICDAEGVTLGSYARSVF